MLLSVKMKIIKQEQLWKKLLLFFIKSFIEILILKPLLSPVLKKIFQQYCDKKTFKEIVKSLKHFRLFL